MIFLRCSLFQCDTLQPVRYAARRKCREVVACAIDFRDRCGPQARYWCDDDDPEYGFQQYGLARLATNVCNQGHFRRHMLTASFTARDPEPTSLALSPGIADLRGTAVPASPMFRDPLWC